MAKVRVPKEHRPPSRFEPFRDPGAARSGAGLFNTPFRCTGKYRAPEEGEFYWNATFREVLIATTGHTSPSVILERVK